MGVHVNIRALRSSDWSWVRERAHPVLCQDTEGVVAEKDGALVAAAIFDSFSWNSCLSHIVIEDPFVLRHRFLELAFSFPFAIKKVALVTGLTPADNLPALRFNRKIGFRETYRIPEGYKPGIDFVFQEMRKDECRWLASINLRAA